MKISAKQLSMTFDRRVVQILMISLFLILPAYTQGQQEKNIQEDPDYWCPKISFLGHAADIFILGKCEYISGISIKLIYNGRLAFPDKLRFTLLDSKGNPMKADKEKRVFGPRQLEKGQFGIYTIQWTGNENPARITIEDVWPEKSTIAQ